jgi:hypothetical protein
MAVNISAQAGQSQITLFEIISNYTKDPISVMGGAIVLEYHESILDATVRASATLVDTGYRNSGKQGSIFESGDTNLNVGEFVNIKIVDGNGNKLDFINDTKFRVLRTTDIDENVNKMNYTINMTSVEYNDNPKDECSVNKRYDGKIDDSIRKILTECLKTKKKINIDPVLNSYNFLGRNQTPFHWCLFLATASIPDIAGAKQNLAGYFFFETADGYQFRSIDTMFSQKPKRILIHNEVIQEVPPPGYDAKILKYSFDRTLDLKKLMETGALGQTISRTFDTSPGNKYDENDFNYKNQFLGNNTGGTQPIVYGDDQSKATKRYFQITDKGRIPSGSTQQQLDKKGEVNYDIDSLVRQAIARYNALFTTKLSIIIAGDITLRAGDLLHCDFIEVSPDPSKTYSDKKSGIYMISDVCHRITKSGCYTSLNLVRDSIGRRPIQRT